MEINGKLYLSSWEQTKLLTAWHRLNSFQNFGVIKKHM